jgi:hypothetical protein
MARISDMHQRWMEEPDYQRAYEALEGECEAGYRLRFKS